MTTPLRTPSGHPTRPDHAWLSQAQQLARDCHGLASHAHDQLHSETTAPRQTLKQTGMLLHTIGDHLSEAVAVPPTKHDPARLSLHLIELARELPKASTELWSADCNGTLAELSRSLPKVSLALMSLSVQVQVIRKETPRHRPRQLLRCKQP